MQTSTEVHDGKIVPVFPLPGAVLFPDTVLPLHIFERRYREMVHDASAGDGLIALSLLRDGELDENERPLFHRVATVGRITDLQSTDDGRFYLKLLGLRRVLLEELDSPFSYRQARLTVLPDAGNEDLSPEAEAARLELQAGLGFLLCRISDDCCGGELLLNDRLPPRMAVNRCCANLPVQAEIRQGLLETDDLRRRRRRATEIVDVLIENVLGRECGEVGRNDERSN